MGEKIYGHHAIEEALKKAFAGSTLYIVRGGGPALAALERQADGLLHVVVDVDALARQPLGLDDFQHALDALELVEVGQVQHHRHLAFLGQAQLAHQGVLLVLGDVVEADLPERHAPRVVQILAHPVDHRVGQAPILGLLRVHADGAPMVDAVARRARVLKLQRQAEIVEEGAGVAAVLAQPERRLHAYADAVLVHGHIIVRRPRDHVDMRLNDRFHAKPPCKHPAFYHIPPLPAPMRPR